MTHSMILFTKERRGGEIKHPRKLKAQPACDAQEHVLQTTHTNKCDENNQSKGDDKKVGAHNMLRFV